MTDSRKRILYGCLAITIVVLAAYCNILQHKFVWDDFDLIVGNAQLKLANIPMFFLSEDKLDCATGYYRPITYISFALDKAIWGVNPLGFNLTNLFLHIAVALAFYRVVAALFRREGLALVAALLFALHPIAVETVNFHAGGRNTLLSASFGMLSMLFYLKKRQVAAVACFGIAIFSKEFALLLPALFFLYDWRVGKERINWLRYLPFAAAALLYLTLRSFAVQNGNLIKSMDISGAIQVVPQVVAGYLNGLVDPFALKTMYDLSAEPAPLLLAAQVALILALIGVGFFFRKKAELLFSVVMFLLFLLPVSNVFSLGTTRMADRYAYFAAFGFCLALAYCICLARKRVALAITASLCLLFLGLDVSRNGVWQDEVSLFSQMVKDAPEMCVGFQNLGHAYYDRHDFVNAEKYLTAAFDKKGLGPGMLTGSASMFMEMQRPEKAITALMKKIENEPGNPQPYMMAATVYEQMGNQSMAGMYRDKALAIDPRIVEMMRKRVLMVCRQAEGEMARGNQVAAERLLTEALSIDPLFAPALVDMGSILAGKGEAEKALHHFQKAAALDRRNAAPHYNLAMLYDSMGNVPMAQAEMATYKRMEQASRQNGNPERH